MWNLWKMPGIWEPGDKGRAESLCICAATAEQLGQAIYNKLNVSFMIVQAVVQDRGMIFWGSGEGFLIASLVAEGLCYILM